MKEEKKHQKEVIEAEILDEKGMPVETAGNQEKIGAEFYQARAGFLTGFVALAFSFIMMLLMAVVTVFIVFPLMLLGRLLGMQIKTFRR
ncbi:MAG: hypothetical protein IJ311_03715 [Elusimicrobiaceae bacterium]|nr:hypothetical protein [Elusimicrobiaceae bacterium]